MRNIFPCRLRGGNAGEGDVKSPGESLDFLPGLSLSSFLSVMLR